MIDQATIDLIGGLASGLIALALFTVEIVSSPKRKLWVQLPEPLRWSIRVTGALMMIRGASLTAVATPFSGQHMPPLALLTSVSMCVTIWGVTWWIISHNFKDKRVWSRLIYALSAEQKHPELIPANVTPDEIIALAEARGIVVLNPDQRDRRDLREASPGLMMGKVAPMSAKAPRD